MKAHPEYTALKIAYGKVSSLHLVILGLSAV